MNDKEKLRRRAYPFLVLLEAETRFHNTLSKLTLGALGSEQFNPPEVYDALHDAISAHKVAFDDALQKIEWRLAFEDCKADAPDGMGGITDYVFEEWIKRQTRRRVEARRRVRLANATRP